MAQRMTDQQIENTIAQAHADVIAVMQVTQEERVVDRALGKALRSCFVAGTDHGQAVILERAETLMADSVVSAQAGQMGRAIVTVLAWVAALEGRQFTGVAATHASVLLAYSDDKEDGFHFHYEHAESATEALSKLATWCTEHATKRDTMPAPAPSEPTMPLAAALPVAADDEVPC